MVFRSPAAPGPIRRSKSILLVTPVEACGLCKELHLANVQLPIPISVTSEEHCTDEIRPHAITGCMCLVAVVEIMYNVVYAVVVAGRGKRERARAPYIYQLPIDRPCGCDVTNIEYWY